MATNEPNYLPTELRRGATEPLVWTYGPLDETQPRYNLTGKTVQMKIARPDGTEIVYGSPIIQISNPTGGEITLSIDGALVTAYTFQNARYVVLLDGSVHLRGPLTIKGLYD